MTDAQFNAVKAYYEAKTGKQFEQLRLYEMNRWLSKMIDDHIAHARKKVPNYDAADHTMVIFGFRRETWRERVRHGLTNSEKCEWWDVPELGSADPVGAYQISATEAAWSVETYPGIVRLATEEEMRKWPPRHCRKR